MTIPLQPSSQINRPLVYIHRVLNNRILQTKTIYADDGRALIFRQTMRLKK